MQHNKSHLLFLPLLFLLTFFYFTFYSISIYSQENQTKGDDLLKAKEYFKRGIILFEAKDYDGALENFLNSYALKPHASIKYNIGVCYLQKQKYAEAANNFEEFLKENTGKSDETISKVLDIMADLILKVGWLTVEVDKKGASINVDGMPCGKSPLEKKIYLDPGNHTVEVISSEGERVKKEITIEPNTGTKLNFTILTPSNATSEKVEKNVKIEKPKGTKERIKKSSGKGITKEGLTTEHREKKTGKLQTFLYISIGLTLAAIAGGSATGAIALIKRNKIDELDRDCKEKRCNEYEEPAQSYIEYKEKRSKLYDEAKIFALSSTIVFAASGLFAGTSLVLFPFSYKGKKQEKQQSLNPKIGISPGKLFVEISF